MLILAIVLRSLLSRGPADTLLSGDGAGAVSLEVKSFPDVDVDGRPISAPPFDVESYLRLPSPDSNAAPLYLDALYEFDNDVALLLGGNPRSARELAAQSHKARIMDLHRRWESDRNAVTDGQIAPMLSSLLTGFKKIETAQTRPECVFETGRSISAIAPHASAARIFLKAAVLKTDHELNRSDVDAAIRNVDTVLRLSRDLRPQGPMVCQFIASMLSGVNLTQITGPILSHPSLTVAQCDQLLEILETHEGKAIDCYAEGLRANYLMQQILLHDIEHGSGDFSPEGLQSSFWGTSQPPSTIAEAIVLQMQQTGGTGGGSFDRQRYLSATEKALVHMASSGAYDKQRAYLNDAFGKLLATADASFAQQNAVAKQVQDELHKPTRDMYLVTVFAQSPWMCLYVITRNRIALQAIKCQCAARRWQLERGGQLSDLETMVQAAGMPTVPEDPFAGQPLKMAASGGDIVIYSIGEDGRDDKGQVDSQCVPDRKGDVVFRLHAWN